MQGYKKILDPLFYIYRLYDKIFLDDTKEVNIMETSLIVKKDSKFEKIRKLLTRIFFKEEYYIEQQLDELFKTKKVNVSKIVIPVEKSVKKVY